MKKERLWRFGLTAVFILILVASNFFFVLVQAESTAGIDTTGAEGDVGNIKDLTEKLAPLAEENRSEFLSAQWKEFLLKGKLISSIDAFCRKINFVFVFLLAREYDLSFTLVLIFFVWLLTLLALNGYLAAVVAKFNGFKNFRFLGALALTIVLAHMQVFYYIATALFKIMLYKTEWYWNLIGGLIIFLILILFFVVNKTFGAKLKKAMEVAANDKLDMEHRMQVQESFRKGLASS